MTRCKVHKYKRFQASSKKHKPNIYHCVRCPSYIGLDYIVGHLTECWSCGQEFIMNENSLQLKPNCGCSSKSNRNKDNKVLDELMDYLGRK